MTSPYTRIIDEILKKIPKPNYRELPSLYNDLDEMTRRIGIILIESDVFDSNNMLLRFDKLNKDKILDLISKDPELMVRFFVMLCGFSVRELERLHGIHDVYSLGTSEREKFIRLAEVIRDNLKHPLYLETALYKFYKNWEEHQKRHYRGRAAEKLVIEILQKHGYSAKKIKVKCRGKIREIDCAIPPDPNNLRVAIQIRRGVLRDLVKRSKEYSSELDELMECYPSLKFVVIYLIAPQDKSEIERAREIITSEREGKRPYDLVILSPEEINTTLVKKLEEWNVSRIR